MYKGLGTHGTSDFLLYVKSKVLLKITVNRKTGIHMCRACQYGCATYIMRFPSGFFTKTIVSFLKVYKTLIEMVSALCRR